MNDIKRIVIISLVTSLTSYYLIKFLDKKKVLPQASNQVKK